MEKQKKQGGFTALETLIVLIVMIAVLGSTATWMKYSADNNQNRIAAENIKQLTNSVQMYARDNFTSFINSDSQEIDFDTLIKENYINKTFSLKNSYSQTYKIIITSNQNAPEDTKTLQVLICTQNGDVITIANMRKIAALAGSNAGYAEVSGKITGNQQAWSLDTPIDAGHLATVSYISKKDIVSAETFLRRSQFDGHPEWNQMDTDLDMQGNTIVAESDNGKSSFNADVLTFENGNQTTTLSSDKGLSLENGGNQTAVNTDGVTVESSGQSATLASNSVGFSASAPVAGLSSFMPSEVAASSVKPALIEVSGTDTTDVWRAADNVCKDDTLNNIGRLVVVSRKNDMTKGLFICGPRDGKQIGSGRAYLINAIGDPKNSDRPSSSNKIYKLDHAIPGCSDKGSTNSNHPSLSCSGAFQKIEEVGNMVTYYCKQSQEVSEGPWEKVGKSDPVCELETCNIMLDNYQQRIYSNKNNCTLKMD